MTPVRGVPFHALPPAICPAYCKSEQAYGSVSFPGPASPNRSWL